jgi:hypothetical protein
MTPHLPRERNMIVRNETEIVRDIQRVVREQMDARGIALKVVAAASGIPYSTLCSYFPGNERGYVPKTPAELPLSAIRKLAGAIPDDLLNLLVPDGWAWVRVPAGIDYDEVAGWAEAFNACKLAAHRADSECQEQIGPNERTELDSIVVAFPGCAAA